MGSLIHEVSVHCPSCGVESAPAQKFCAECGTSLETRACPGCGADVNPDHKFCPDCGQSLTGTAAVMPADNLVAERRLVTSLFCDLVGFTALCEDRDPEEIRSILTAYFERAQTVVARFGGVIDKYTGDAITVFWGATTAQADDAERAVRAGLELVDAVARLGEEIGVPLQLRVGVLTGETAVGPGGNETGLVLGDVVNTAARLQAIAEPGTVAVGDATKDMTEGAILYEEVGWHELKGKGQPVRVWRPISVVAALGGRRRPATLEPPFVGRTYELRLLKELLHVTGEERRARLVTVVGEAGIGKSRLISEFQNYVDGLVEDVYWHQGRSPAYTEGPTAWALGEMVRSRAGIGELDDSVKAYMRLRTAVATYIADPEERRWIEPRLAGLLGLDEMPGGDRNELYAAIRTFFERIAERGTVVLVFEDIHWADDGVVGFIGELVDRARQHPILVLALARPDVGQVTDEIGRGWPNLTSLHLGPLAESAMRELVGRTVPGLGSALTDQIVERAAGVPLYALEMLRMLVGDGTLQPLGDGTYSATGDVGSIAVPDSLQSLIGARIDRLPADLRAIVKHAAVLGHSFSPESLGVVTGQPVEVVEPQLARLVEAEVLRLEDEPRSPERGQYEFVQGLIREVAYGRLTLTERRQRHLAVADHFERAGDVEVAAVVASHLLDAYRADPAATDAPELAVRGRQALVRAAQRAADLHSHRQVLNLAERAAELAIERGAKAEMDLLRAGAARGPGGLQTGHRRRPLRRGGVRAGVGYGQTPARRHPHWHLPRRGRLPSRRHRRDGRTCCPARPAGDARGSEIA